MKEANLVKHIKADLIQDGYAVIKTSPGPYTPPGIPDLLAWREGQGYAIEVKVGSNKPTVLQLARLRDLSAAGVVCIVTWERLPMVTLRGLALPDPGYWEVKGGWRWRAFETLAGNAVAAETPQNGRKGRLRRLQGHS